MPCRSRRSARDNEVSNGSTVIGLDGRYPPHQAAFANACLARNLDYNDTFNSTTGGHPSDMIPGIFAAVEADGGSGSDLIHGVDVAYEVFAALADTVPLRDYGWDQGVFIAIGCAAGIAAGVGLGEDAASHAISLAVTSSNGLRVTRSGNLSAWKGCATPHAVQNAVSVTRLATLGMSRAGSPVQGSRRIPAQSRGTHRHEKSRPAARWQVGSATHCHQVPASGVVRPGAGRAFSSFTTVSILPRWKRFRWLDRLPLQNRRRKGMPAQKWDPRTRETAEHAAFPACGCPGRRGGRH